MRVLIVVIVALGAAVAANLALLAYADGGNDPVGSLSPRLGAVTTTAPATTTPATTSPAEPPTTTGGDAHPTRTTTTGPVTRTTTGTATPDRPGGEGREDD